MPAYQCNDSGVSWDFGQLQNKRYCAEVWFSLTQGIPGVRSLRKRFIADVFRACPAWLTTHTRQALSTKLHRAMPGASLRKRANDAELSKRKAKLAASVLRLAAKIEHKGHKKGAGKPRAWMDLRATLAGLWNVDEVRGLAQRIMDKPISFTAFERIFREHYGKVSPIERAADRYVQHTLGLRVDWCGQIVQMDGTELPIEVLNGWGRARKDGRIDYPCVFITDAGSLRTWLLCEGVRSEVQLWDPLLLRFFEQERYAPEIIITDEGGRSFNALRWQHPDKPISLNPGVRVALAAGVKPYCHLPKNPRAKGAVEAGGVKAGKSTAKRVLTARFAKALLRELREGEPCRARHYRQIESQAAFHEVMREIEAALNARRVARIGDGRITRMGAWDLDEMKSKRRERALADDFRERMPEIITRGIIMEYRSGMKLYRGKARAELAEPLAGCRANDLRGAMAILFPGGLRAGDEERGPDFMRGVMIQSGQGQPRYHAIEAFRVKKTFLGFEADRPALGGHPVSAAMPEQQHRASAWPAARRDLEAERKIIRQGTTDDVVPTGSPVCTND